MPLSHLMSLLTLTTILVISSVTFADAPPAESESGFVAIINKYNKAALSDVRQYITENPSAKDIDQAYLFLLQNSVGLESEVDALTIAEQYLAREKTNPQLKIIAQQVRALALVNQGRGEEAVKTLKELLTDRQSRNAGALVDFGFNLANHLQLSGNLKETRVAFEAVSEAFPLNQEIESMVETRLDRLELIGSPPPALNGKDWQGKNLDLNEYKGKVLLIDFWATWCGPCMQIMPDLMKNYATYHEQGFEMIGITLDEQQEQAQSLVKKAGIPWRMAMNEFEGKELGKPYSVPGIPGLFLVDREGKVAFVDLRGEDLRKAIEKLLKADPGPKAASGAPSGN